MRLKTTTTTAITSTRRLGIFRKEEQIIIIIRDHMVSTIIRYQGLRLVEHRLLDLLLITPLPPVACPSILPTLCQEGKEHRHHPM